MKIKFTGVPGEEHEKLSMFGKEFWINKWVEVKDAYAQRVLSNHPHFECQGKPVDNSTPAVLPQTIPVTEDQMVVKLGNATVTEGELREINNDPMVQEAGVHVDYAEALDAKGASDGIDPKSDAKSSN